MRRFQTPIFILFFRCLPVSAFCGRHHENTRAPHHSPDLQLWEDGMHWSQEVSPYRIIHRNLCCNTENGSQYIPVKLHQIHCNKIASNQSITSCLIPSLPPSLPPSLLGCQWGAVEASGQEVRPRGAEAGLPSQVSGLQNPEHGGQLRRQVPHQAGGPGPYPPTVQQVTACAITSTGSRLTRRWKKS